MTKKNDMTGYWTSKEILQRGGVLTYQDKEKFKRDFDESSYLANLYLQSIQSELEEDWVRVFKPSMEKKGWVRKWD